MTVKLLVDMNLSPNWVPVLKSHGWSVVHQLICQINAAAPLCGM